MTEQTIYYIALGIGILLLAVVLLPFKAKKTKIEKKTTTNLNVSEKKEKDILIENLPIGKIKGDSHKSLIEEIKKRKKLKEAFIDEEFFEDQDDLENGESIEKYFNNLFDTEIQDGKVEIEILSNKAENYIESEGDAIEFQNEKISEFVEKKEVENFFDEIENNVKLNKELINSADKIFDKYEF